MDKKLVATVGALLVIILVTGVVYVKFENLKIKVGPDNTKFFSLTTENGFTRWRTSGTEYDSLFDGTTKLNRNISGITIVNLINESNNHTTMIRTTPYIRGPVIVATYEVDGTIDRDEVDLFPTLRLVEIYNASGFFYRYEVRDLIYDDPSVKVKENHMEFGRNMKIEWQEENKRWARVYKTGILKVQYNIPSDYEEYSLRLFDPPISDYIIDGDKVYVNSTYGYLEIYPHTTAGEPVVFNFTSRFLNEMCLDFAFGIDISDDEQKKFRLGKVELYSPRNATWGNVTYNYTCAHNFSYTTNPKYAWCWIWNEGNSTNTTIFEHSFNTGDILTKTIWWNETEIVTPSRDFLDITSKLKKKDTTRLNLSWYVLGNTMWNYSLNRWFKFTPNIKISRHTAGKYWVFVKRCQNTVQEAYSSGYYVLLDPWWNASYAHRINVSTAGLSPNQEFLINGTDCFYINSTKTCIRTINNGTVSVYFSNTSNIRILGNDTYFLPVYCEEGPCTSYDQPDAFGLITEFYDFEDTGANALDKVGQTNNWTMTNALRNTSFSYVANKSMLVPVTTGDNVNMDYAIEPEALKTVCWAQYIYSRGGAGGTSIVYTLLGNNTRRVYMGFGRSDGVSIWYYDGNWQNTGLDFVNATWEYYCLGDIDFSGGTYNIYRDGDKIVDNANMNVASSFDGTLTVFMLDGFIAGSYTLYDEVAFYTTNLTDAQINATYQNYLNTATYGNLGEEEDVSVNNAPIVTLTSVDGATTNGTLIDDATPDVIFTVTDSDIGDTLDCEVIVNATRYGENTSVTNNTATTITVNTSLTDNTNYHFIVECNDGTAFVNSTTLRLSILTLGASIELGSQYNFTVNEDSNYTCIDINHSDYGDKYACGGSPFNVSFNISYFERTSFGRKTLEEYYDTYNGSVSHSNVYGDNWKAQTFNVSEKMIVQQIDLEGKRNGLPGILYVELQLTDGSGKPNGSTLSTGTFNASILTTSKAWFRIDMEDYEIVANQTYAIVMYLLGGNSSNEFRSYFDHSGSNYSKGIRYYSANGGDSWVVDSDGDITFKVYGVAESSNVFSYSVNMTGPINETIYVDAHHYDEVEGLQLNLTGAMNSGTIPKEVKIYINSSLSNYVGALFEETETGTDTFSDEESSKNLTYSSSGGQIVYFKVPKNANVTSAFMDIEGFGREYMIKGTSQYIDAIDEIYPFSTVWYKQKVNITDTIYAIWTGTRSSFYDSAGLYAGNGSLIESFSTTDHKVYLTTPYTPSSGEILSYKFEDHIANDARHRAETYWVEPVERGGMLYPGYEGYGSPFKTDVVRSLILQFFGRSNSTNPHIEVGNIDGEREWNYSGGMNESITMDNFSTSINSFLVVCTEDDDGFCTVPMYVTSGSAGTLILSGLNISYGTDINPIGLSVNLTQDYLDNETEYTRIPITIENQYNGTITISGLKYDYAGGNDSIEVVMYDSSADIQSFIEEYGVATGSITFSGSENKTKHFWIPLWETVESAVMNITGSYVVGDVNRSAITEVYNVSSYACDPWSGSFDPNCTYGVDGNVSSYTTVIGYQPMGVIEEEYDIPSGAVIPENVDAAQYNFKYETLCNSTSIYTRYWDYGIEQWATLEILETYINASYERTIVLPVYAFGDENDFDNGIRRNPIFRHWITDCIKYYEGWMGFYNGTAEYTLNPYMEIGTPDGDYEWNYTGNYTSTETTDDFAAELNTAVNGGVCNCTGCSIINISIADNGLNQSVNGTGYDGQYYTTYSDDPLAETFKWMLKRFTLGGNTTNNITIPDKCRNDDLIKLRWTSHGTASLGCTGWPSCWIWATDAWTTDHELSGHTITICNVEAGGIGYESNMWDNNWSTYAGWSYPSQAWKQNFGAGNSHSLFEESGVYIYENNYCSVPVLFHSDETGKLGYGSILITGPENKSINRTFLLTNYYSDWNYSFPQYIDWLEFIPKTPTAKNVTPYGQTAVRPILNITNQGYGGMNSNFSIYLNETHSCVNLTMSITDNKSDGSSLNATWRDYFTNFSYLESQEFWMWADYGCNYTTWKLWEPDLSFRNCCEDCVCSEDI